MNLLFRPMDGPHTRVTPVTLLWAALLGLAGGFAGVLTRLTFRLLQWCITGNSGSPADAAASLPHLWRFLIPVGGALLAIGVACLRNRFAPDLPPTVDYIQATRESDGTIPFRPILWRTLSAACSIATGATIGREGVMIQFAASVASRVGSLVTIAAFPLTRQVACGVAAGVAAAYQSPIAAVFFAAEIVLLRVSLQEVVLLGVSAGMGWKVSSLMLGDAPLFRTPLHVDLANQHWGWIVFLAVFLGALGPLYQSLTGSMTWMRHLPAPLIWSGAIVGAFSLLSAKVWGNGDVALMSLLHPVPGTVPIFADAALVLLLRSIATPICVGTGTVGGIFTPTLFAGASAGFLLAYQFGPGTHLLCILVGMGGLLASVTHAPLMSSFIVVELTGRWEALPVLLACNFISSEIAARISPWTMYGIASGNPRHREEHSAGARSTNLSSTNQSI